MKKLLFTLLIGITTLAYSQAPQKISYQGVARNASGAVLANQPIGIRFDIHQGSASGSIVFSETHTGVSTNAFGLFTAYIGSINNLSVITWATNSYFIEVSIDPNTGTFSSLGAQQLMSVPYALNAGSAPSPAVSFTNNILSVGGNTTTIPAGTTYTAGTGINVAGSTITNTAPDQTITITPAGSASVTGTYPNFIISTPIVQTYTAGNGIAITGGVISNTAAAVTPTIVGTGATTVNGVYPNLTINTPTVAPDQIVSITGLNSATVTGAYPNFTVNVPNGSTLPNALSGQFLYNTGTVWDTLPRNNLYFDGTNFGIGTTSPQANFHVVGAGRFDASVSTPHVFTNTVTVSGGTLGQVLTSDASGNGTFQNLPVAQTPTITSTGIAVVTPTTGNTFNVDVPVSVLSYSAGTNVLSLSQGTTVTTATLNGTGSSTVSVVGSGLATVTPTTGSTFTVSVPNPTLSIASGSLSISNGNSVAIPSPSLTINSNSLIINGPGGNTVVLPTSSTTTLTQGSNVTVSGSAPSYTVSAPAYSITLPGGNVVQITNGVSTSTAPISSTNLTLNGVNNNILSAGGNTVGLNTYTAGTGISITGSAPNYVINNTIPAAVTQTLIGTGISSVTPGANTFTVNTPMPIYTETTGVLSFGGTNTVVVTPTLSLTGTTLTSGPATNSVNLSGFNGIYGGSGSIQTGSTTVTVGTNTLTFLSGNTINKPIANFFGGGITGTSMTLGHIGTNSANFKFIGSATTTPVDYGYVSGSTNGISISGGTSSNGLYATNNAEIGVGSFTTGTGKFVITHTASQANPTMHLRETSGGLNRIKFSNNTVANKFFETAAQTNAVDGNGAYSINYFDGATYKPVMLVTGDKKVNINNLNTVLGSLHVMENATTAGGGIISEGFAQSAQINLARNNQAGLAARLAVVNGDEIGKVNFSGYDGTTFGDGAKIYAKAAENVTGSNKGTELIFAAVPTGTNSNREVFKINAANKLEVITSMIIPFGAGAGRILTSDALGNASWQAASASGWALTGNSGTVDGTNFIGTTDNVPLTLKVNNIRAGRIDNSKSSAFYGMNAGTLLTSGTLNSGFGDAALYQITTGTQNSAVGAYALYFNNTGNYNTALGAYGLNSNTSGSNNTTTGARSMFNNSNGFDNAANGFEALYSNTTGYQNTASGSQSLRSNIGGYSNSAFGIQTLFSNTTGSENQAFGFRALYNNTTGYQNSATGSGAMFNNTTGYANTADGKLALYGNTTGIQNVGVGYYAGKTNQIGDNNTFIGHQSDASVNNLINAMAIGANATVTASNKVQIGNASITHVQLGAASTATLETGLVKITGGSPGAGKVLTSDAAGLASWQTVSAPVSPWIQGASIVTLSNIGDKVGIGTNAPGGALDITHNAAGLPGIIINSNALTNTDGIRVVQSGTGNGLFSGIYNSSSPAKAIEAQSSGVGVTFGAANSGTGGAGNFQIINATSSAIALTASSNGGGTVIYANNTNTSNISAVIQANSNSSGVAIYANNTVGSTSQFDNNSSSTAVNAINNSTGNALYASAISGNAINATSSGNSSPTALINNTGTSDGVQVFATGARAILAQSSSNGTAALEVNNTGTGIAITGIKGAGSTGGSVATFANSSSSNGSDAVIVNNSGAAAGVHVISAATSTVGLHIDAGHIKATGAQVGVTCTLSSFTTTATFSFSGVYNDVKGKVNISCPSLAIPLGGSIDVNIQFVKPYPAGVSPIVVATASVLNLNTTIQSQSNSNFTVRLTNNSGAILGGVTNFSFNYFVIE